HPTLEPTRFRDFANTGPVEIFGLAAQCRWLLRHQAFYLWHRLHCPCAVTRRRFPVGANPTRRTLQPEATGAAMEVTKWLKPSDSGSRNTVTARVCRPQRE